MAVMISNSIISPPVEGDSPRFPQTPMAGSTNRSQGTKEDTAMRVKVCDTVNLRHKIIMSSLTF